MGCEGILEFLDDDGAGKTSLLDGLIRISELGGRKAHGLEAVSSVTSWSGCIDESPDVFHCVIMVETSYHPCPIS